MLILVDNPTSRSQLTANVRRRIAEEIEEVAADICAGETGERPLRRLRALTKILASIEVSAVPVRQRITCLDG